MQKLVKMSGLEGAPAASLTRTEVPTAPSSSGESCKKWQSPRAKGKPPPRFSSKTFMCFFLLVLAFRDLPCIQAFQHIIKLSSTHSLMQNEPDLAGISGCIQYGLNQRIKQNSNLKSQELFSL